MSIPAHRPTGCEGKIAYPSAHAAHRALKAARSQRKKYQQAKVYRCPFCHAYHHARIT
jgi:hypothetical protein